MYSAMRYVFLDKKVLASLHTQKIKAKWYFDVSSFELKSNLDRTLAAYIG